MYITDRRSGQRGGDIVGHVASLCNNKQIKKITHIICNVDEEKKNISIIRIYNILYIYNTR